MLHQAVDEQQVAPHELSEVMPADDVNYKDLWQNAMEVNRSISELCILFEKNLHEERETLKMVYNLLEKVRAASDHDAPAAVTNSKPKRSGISHTFVSCMHDMFICALLILLFLISLEWMIASEAKTRDLIYYILN